LATDARGERAQAVLGQKQQKADAELKQQAEFKVCAPFGDVQLGGCT
jgi:hypothetical protein